MSRSARADHAPEPELFCPLAPVECVVMWHGDGISARRDAAGALDPSLLPGFSLQVRILFD